MRKQILLFFAVYIIIHCTFNIENCICQWVQTNGLSGIQVNKLSSNSNFIIAGTTNGIYLSSNNGNNWSARKLSNQYIISLASNEQYIYAGTNGNGLFVSSNNGENWNTINTGLSNLQVQTLNIIGNNLIAGTGGGGLFVTSNNGVNWNTLNNGLTVPYISSFANSGTYFFAGTGGGGIFLSTDNGSSWSFNNFQNKIINSIHIVGVNVFACVFGDGVYLSTNNGSTWTPKNTDITNLYTRCLESDNTNVFLGTGNGVYLTTNNGNSWLLKNQGFYATPIVNSLLVNNGYIYSASYLLSVWRRSLSEIIGIKKINSGIPREYFLEQNYPNPFNQSTMFNFQCPMAGMVELNVFDMLGREVAVIVNEYLQAGTYEVRFDVGNLPSGIYFYQLKADYFSDTKKLILIK